MLENIFVNKGVIFGISIVVILGISISVFAVMSDKSEKTTLEEIKIPEDSNLEQESRQGRDLTVELNENLGLKGN